MTCTKTAVFDNIHLTKICTVLVHINHTQPSKPTFIYEIHIDTAHFISQYYEINVLI